MTRLATTCDEKNPGPERSERFRSISPDRNIAYDEEKKSTVAIEAAVELKI